MDSDQVLKKTTSKEEETISHWFSSSNIFLVIV